MQNRKLGVLISIESNAGEWSIPFQTLFYFKGDKWGNRTIKAYREGLKRKAKVIEIIFKKNK